MFGRLRARVGRESSGSQAGIWKALLFNLDRPRNKVIWNKFHFILGEFQMISARYQEKPVCYQIVLNRYHLKPGRFLLRPYGFPVRSIKTKCYLSNIT